MKSIKLTVPIDSELRRRFRIQCSLVGKDMAVVVRGWILKFTSLKEKQNAKKP